MLEFGYFVAGLGVGLSVGLGVALWLMAARDPAARSRREPTGQGSNVTRYGS